jgi:hypothetical protein
MPIRRKFVGLFCRHRWSHTSTSGCPVLALSTCQTCGRKASAGDLDAWRSLKRMKEIQLRQQESA